MPTPLIDVVLAAACLTAVMPPTALAASDKDQRVTEATPGQPKADATGKRGH